MGSGQALKECRTLVPILVDSEDLLFKKSVVPGSTLKS